MTSDNKLSSLLAWQFGHINSLVSERLAAGEPVISVNATRKQLGSYANGGRE